MAPHAPRPRWPGSTRRSVSAALAARPKRLVPRRGCSMPLSSGTHGAPTAATLVPEARRGAAVAGQSRPAGLSPQRHGSASSAAVQTATSPEQPWVWSGLVWPPPVFFSCLFFSFLLFLPAAPPCVAVARPEAGAGPPRPVRDGVFPRACLGGVGRRRGPRQKSSGCVVWPGLADSAVVVPCAIIGHMSLARTLPLLPAPRLLGDGG